MPASSNIHLSRPTADEGLRLQLSQESSASQVDGAWWPRSRDLQAEAADLVDNFPPSSGRISRLLFSRPDWDWAPEGHVVRAIAAARGLVKVGSFPSDDTHLMVVTMGSGQRFRLTVIPSDTPAAEGERSLQAIAEGDSTSIAAVDSSRWDDETPGG